MSWAPCLAKHQEWLPPSSGLPALQLWAQMQLWSSSVALCPSLLFTVRGDSRFIFGLMLKARGNSMSKFS